MRLRDTAHSSDTTSIRRSTKSLRSSSVSLRSSFTSIASFDRTLPFSTAQIQPKIDSWLTSTLYNVVTCKSRQAGLDQLAACGGGSKRWFWYHEGGFPA